MSLVTICRPSRRHETLKPGEKCDYCGLSYDGEQTLKKFVEDFKAKLDKETPHE